MNLAAFQKLKLHGSVFPQSINGTDTTGTGVNTSGYTSAMCVFISGAIGAADFDKLQILHADADTGYAALSGATFAGSLPGDSADNKIYVIYLDLRKCKKWITWNIDPGAAASLVCGIIILGGADESPDSVTERGIVAQVIQ